MPINYTLMGLPPGKAGVRETLKKMSSITKGYKSAPAVRELSLSVVASVPEKQWKSEVRAILRWVQSNIAYRRDIRGVETLQTPIQTLRLRQGDCDDQSVLLASMLESIGHPTKFVAVGPEKGILNHVLVKTKIGGAWAWCEPIMNWPLGRGPKFNDMVERHN